MDAIELLERHHRQLEKEFSALKDSEAVDAAAFRHAADLLVTHITIEEQQFYPAVQAKRTEDILLESLEEHLSLKRVLADLVALPCDDPQFGPKLHVLAEQLEHHHEEEEENLFPKVKKLLDADAREELGQRMQAQIEVLERGAPRELVLDQTDAAHTLDPDAA
jgi:hemerythrin superfamily protein